MKVINTAIVTTILALGLAGNSMAAPGHSHNYKVKQYSAQTKHQKAKKPSKKIAIHKQAKRKAIKKAIKRAAAKRVIKVATKRAITKRAISKHVSKKMHRVRSGDTLYRIAARNNISVQKLVKLNKLWGNKANNLRVGMVLRLG